MSTAPDDSARLYNKTRTSASIPEKLLRDGKFYLLPIYYVMRLSDLAREGVEGSGSFRFADHIYRYEASGQLGIGTVLDWIILRLPSSRSFRNRYLSARAQVIRHARELAAERDEVRILSIPCGLPRELRDAAVTLRRESPEVFAKCRFHGMDLDPEPLELAKAFVAAEGLTEKFAFRQGNALVRADFPEGMDIVTSTGLADFLNDEQLATFAGNVHAILRPGGVLHTSGMKPHGLSDWLMRNLAELHTQYRDLDALERVIEKTGYTRLRLAYDDLGIQTLVVARK